jgi:exopolysaccharide biosynthesis polyprenyl glycosylphosphotransferase
MELFSSLITHRIIPFLKKWNLWNLILGFIDIVSIFLAFQCSYIINYFDTGGLFFQEPRLLKLFILILPIWLMILYLIQITEIPRTKSYFVLFIEYLQSTLLVVVMLMVFYFVFKLYEISRLFLLEFALFGFLFLFFVRLIEYKVLKSYRAKGYNYVNLVLIADDSALPFIENLINVKEWGYRITAVFTQSALIKEKYETSIIQLPEEYLETINDLMEADIIDEVVYFKKRVVPAEVRKVMRSCEELGVIFRIKDDENRINLTNAVKTDIAHENFLTFINIPYNPYALALKRITDIGVSLFLLLCLSPVLVFIGAWIKLSSPGDIIYSQTRVGLRGRPFKLYKFRTMVANADFLRKQLEAANEADGPAFKMKDDPRVTKIGKVLRKTGLDELPQLLNILKGEMSLIGPRPPLPDETKLYERWQLRRLSVRPGLSCFWQIKPDRNSIKFDKWMEMDLTYIDNWSIRLDFVILLKTIKTVFQRTGL